MKLLKKIATLMLVMCLTVPSFSMLTFAAEGRIMFTDPSTAVGETLELKGVITSDTDIEDRSVEMVYDTEMLKFKNGDNVTEVEPGKLRYEVKGQRDGNRVEFLMYFDVLKEGTTEVKAIGYKAWDSSDAKITCQMGASSIKIAEGEITNVEPETPDVSSESVVEVNGVTYSFVSEFSEEVIPEGYEETTISYNDAQYRIVENPTNGVTLGYLVDANGVGEFFLYDIEKTVFLPYEEISISDTTSIVLLTDVDGIVLPEIYAETTVEVNGKVFPAWGNTEDTTSCIFYAVNTNGVKSLYQYDTTEGTYQRFVAPTVEEEQEDDSVLGKITNLLENHLDYVVLGTGI